MRPLKQKIVDKIKHEQSGIPTFSDNLALFLINNSNNDKPNPELNLYEQNYFNHERFVNYDTNPVSDSSFVSRFQFSQGWTDCLKWKNKPIFKTVYDMAILHMLLWELQPKTIIEMGSGNGSSAEYMKDIMKMYNADCTIFSFDIQNKNTVISENSVNFLHCDCNDIQTLNKIDYANLPHPWLIVEDSHVNVFGVLEFLNTFAIPGDYFYIEDINFEKRIDVEKFLKLGNFKLDLKYLNYFGKNMTCAKNGILKKYPA